MNKDKKVRRVLIPYFGDEFPEEALGKALNRMEKGGELFLLNIRDEAQTRSLRYRTGEMGEESELVKTFKETQKKVQREAAEEFNEKAKERAAKYGVSTEPLYAAGDPAEEVLKAIDEHSIQLVILESLRDRMSEILLGDEIDYLREEAPCEVLTISE